MTLADAQNAMMLALEEANLALEEGEIPVGAVILQNGSVIARGHNLRETPQDPMGHAEIVAIRRAAEALGTWRLDNCDLIVTLEPCCMCAGAIAAARLQSIIYGAADPAAGCCGSIYSLTEDPALPGRRVPVHAGIMAEECERLLSSFFLKKREENPCCR